MMSGQEVGAVARKSGAKGRLGKEQVGADLLTQVRSDRHNLIASVDYTRPP